MRPSRRLSRFAPPRAGSRRGGSCLERRSSVELEGAAPILRLEGRSSRRSGVPHALPTVHGYDTDPRRFGCGERDACVCRCRCPDSACNMKVPSEADGGWCCVRILSSGEIGRPVRSARLTTEISQGIVHTDGSPPCLILRVR